MSCCAGPLASATTIRAESSARIGLLEELNADARHLAGGGTNYQIALPAMHCGNCIITIERGLSPMFGIEKVRANLSLKQVSVTLKPGNDNLQPVLSKLETLGFTPQSPGAAARAGNDEVLSGLLRAVAVSGFAAANIMLLSVPVWSGAAGTTEALFHYLSALIAVPTVAYAGRPFFISALQALRHGRVNMDVPISLGVILATMMSFYESVIGGGHAYFDAAVSLLFFLLIGRALDQMMRSKARAAASRLAALSAKGGMVVDAQGDLTYLPLDGIKPGMVLRVAAGERFPVDGTVIEGATDIDRALVTGESAPIAVTTGAAVEAGTLNLTGAVDVETTRSADQSFLAEVTQMMAAAEHGRSAYIQLSDRMARAYAPVVHILAATTFVGWMIWTHGGFHESLTAAVSVLIITCPCALGLAVPVAHVVSAGRLFAAGIFMKDGSALERMATIDEIAYDKTGTLTTGEPVIKTMHIPLGEPVEVARALASRSVHPAAKALAKALASFNMALVSDLHEVPGHGVEAIANGRKARLGRINWVAEIASRTTGGHETGVAFALEGGPLYYSTLSESLRSGATRLPKLDSFVISGDGAEQVEAIAHAVGIAETHAGLKPGDKLALLQQKAAEGHHVLMVGDGLNDAPALAAAYASMAPSSASDVGRMAADFVFTRDDLSAIGFTYKVALKTARIVKQNFGLAIVYNIFAVPLAMSGQLNPLIAAVAMSTSSIIVVANSLRLQLVRS
ncbi:heavy metal translocating P-type ATPase [Aestuariivirga litoralis]|nr:heavy metal translocating P-type ATPase [Aestuariivirga litoralis]MBG1230738.1 heavy metal translocating P-type ATPase [Aestuariivirga litoralis]